MAQLEANARLVISRLSDEVAPLEAGLVEAVKDVTQAELTQIRSDHWGRIAPNLL
jgi:hypothetical protein